MHRTRNIRIALFQIIFAIFAASILFVIDHYWNDAAARWSALAYVLINGLVLTLYFRRSRQVD